LHGVQLAHIMVREAYMNLAQLIGTIVSSQPTDWNHIPCWGTNSGPSYRDELSFHGLYYGQRNVLHVKSHPNTASYIPDVSVTLAYGLEWMDDFKEPWINNFPAPKTTAHFADVFYNGALVFRTAYVHVDGHDLPWPPADGSLKIPRAQAQFSGLLDAFGKISRFDDALRTAGMNLTDDTWPTLGI
jgi:hypothetical protein